MAPIVLTPRKGASSFSTVRKCRVDRPKRCPRPGLPERFEHPMRSLHIPCARSIYPGGESDRCISQRRRRVTGQWTIAGYRPPKRRLRKRYDPRIRPRRWNPRMPYQQFRDMSADDRRALVMLGAAVRIARRRMGLTAASARRANRGEPDSHLADGVRQGLGHGHRDVRAGRLGARGTDPARRLPALPPVRLRVTLATADGRNTWRCPCSTCVSLGAWDPTMGADEPSTIDPTMGAGEPSDHRPALMHPSDSAQVYGCGSRRTGPRPTEERQVSRVIRCET